MALFFDFLRKCLSIDPGTRMSASQAINHPFLNLQNNQIKLEFSMIPAAGEEEKISKNKDKRSINEANSNIVEKKSEEVHQAEVTIEKKSNTA